MSINVSFDVEAQASHLTGIDARARLVSSFWTVISVARFIRAVDNHQLTQEIEEDDDQASNHREEEAPLLITETGTATDQETCRQAWMRFILLIRSVQIFKHGTSARCSSSRHQITHSQDSASLPLSPTSSTHHHDEVPHSTSGRPDMIKLQHIQQRKSIAEIVKNKNLDDLRNYGGVRGVAEALNTDLETGISTTQRIFHSQQPTNHQLYWFLSIVLRSFLEASNNHTIILLTCAAILSLFLGIKEDGMRDFGWLNGTILISNICVIIVFTTVHKCWQEWSNKKLENSCCWHSTRKAENVLIIRDGDLQRVCEAELEVGDLAILRKGGQIPADGLFISCADQVPLELGGYGSVKPITVDEEHPFLFYGSRVVNGNAKMLVTSTCMDTFWGERMSQASEENKCKSFESYIHNVSSCVHISGLLISILIIVVMFLRYRAGEFDDERRYRPESKGEPTRVKTITDAITGIITGTKGTARVFMTLLSVSLLGVLEGMPFVVSMATIIWSSETLAGKATERGSLACLNVASVTIICTDKFGGLSEHEKEIDHFCVGGEFVSESSVVDSRVLEGLCDGIGTQFIIPPSDFESATLEPLVCWAETNLGLKKASVIEQCKMEWYKGRNPLQDRCQVLMEKTGNEWYLHCNGQPFDILSLCSHQYDSSGEFKEIDEPNRRMLEEITNGMIAEKATVIAYACKRVDREIDEVSVDDEPKDLILLAIISMKEVKIEVTKEAISTLMEGGIKTILTSGDDVSILEPIGQKCGLIAPDSDDDQLVLTGEQFRNWSDEEKMDKSDKICVMGNCLPSDKTLLIEILQRKGHVVALVAQKTLDAPSLKRADIGLTFGTWSSEVARERCDIAIWGSSCYGLIVDVIKSGRCFQDNIRKFVQLYLTFTISSSLIIFFSVVSLGESSITPVELFWLNLVVTLVGGLALMTCPVVISTVRNKSSAKLITKAMWRNIVIQASYQTSVFVTLHHKGEAILGRSGGGRVKSMIYNGYFLCQVFSKFIAREPEKRNIFRGLQLFRNTIRFWLALVIFVICQAIFCMAESALGDSPGLDLKSWGVCLLIGLVSWLLDWAGKCFFKVFEYKLASNCFNLFNTSDHETV